MRGGDARGHRRALRVPGLGRPRGRPWPLFAALAVGRLLLVVSAAAPRLGPPRAAGPRRLGRSSRSRGTSATSSSTDVLRGSPRTRRSPLAFLVAALRASSAAASRTWNERSAPWLASALARPGLLPAAVPGLRGRLGQGLDRRAARGPRGGLGRGALARGQAGSSSAGTPLRRAPAAAPPGALRARSRSGFVTLAIPLQLDRQWITRGAGRSRPLAVWWLFGRLPASRPQVPGGGLLARAWAPACSSTREVLRYQDRGLPIFNWLLYTYGVPALCCFVGRHARSRGRARRRRPTTTGPGRPHSFGPAVSLLGPAPHLLADQPRGRSTTSPAGRYVELGFERQLARDLTLSVAWGLYAIVAPRPRHLAIGDGPCASSPSASWC